MKLIKTSEAAAILRLTPSRVRQLCESGALPATRTGITSGHWRVDETALMKMLSQQPTITESSPAAEQEQIDWDVFRKAKG
jgi:excisionase family DNA binding protein